MSAWKVILATVVIFGTGVFTGGILVKLTNKPEARPAPMVFRIEMMRRLTRELNLTPEQNVRIDRSLREGAERVKILGSLIEPEMQQEFKKAREEIQAQLTPPQRQHFESLWQQRQRLSEEFLARNGVNEGARNPKFNRPRGPLPADAAPRNPPPPGDP